MQIIGVIEISTNFIELVIYEKREKNIAIIEKITEDIYFLKNLTGEREISFEKSKKLCNLLKAMKWISKDYGVEKLEIIFSPAFEEISNFPLVLDQIGLYGELDVSNIDLDLRKELEVKKLLYIENELMDKKQNLFFLNLNPFNLELYTFYKGHLILNENIGMGSYKLVEIIDEQNISPKRAINFVQDYKKNYLDYIKNEIGRKKIGTLILDGEIEQNLFKNIIPEEIFTGIDVSILREFFKKFEKSSYTEIGEECSLTLLEAKLFFSSLCIIVSICEYFEIDRVKMLNCDIKEILALENFNLDIKKNLEEKIWKITLDSVIDLGVKYNFNIKHSEFVLNFGQKLFKLLEEKHRLDKKYQRYYIIASYLHDIGKYIGFKYHNRHSCYLLENAYIFGLSKKDIKNIVFLIYAHNTEISIKDLYKFDIEKTEFVKLLKVAAILKVAVALDRSKKQKVLEEQFFVDKTEIILELNTNEDLYMEQYSFNSQMGLFKYVFDLDIKLKINRGYHNG